MSRIAKKPIPVPAGVDINVNGHDINVKGPLGTLSFKFSEMVSIEKGEEGLQVVMKTKDSDSKRFAGTTSAIVKNMIVGTKTGFEKQLKLVGVGYRAQVQGSKLNLTLGLSHPVNFDIPVGLTINTPSNTDIVIKGIDKQLVGETAAKIRALRAPEAYKGKGIRYADEVIHLKETKKK